MARKYGQRLKPLYVLDILREKSDEEHPVTAAYICGELEKRGITAERKSVYADIAALTDYGFDIIKSGNPRGWFLASREFEEPEIYLLADAVRTAKFISASKTRSLIEKLDFFLSESSREKREKRVWFSPSSKCDNEEIFYSIDNISAAIKEKVKIEFDYVSRTLTNNRRLSKSIKHMKISPYALTWQDDHYYVIGNYEKYDNLIHLRLDRMKKVNKTDEKQRHFSFVSKYSDYFDVSDYTAGLFSMYGGRLCDVELCCKKTMTEQAADRFGENIFIKNVTDDEFCFTVKAALSDALVTWIISFGDKIRVLSPPELIDMTVNRAKEVQKKYENGENHEKNRI